MSFDFNFGFDGGFDGLPDGDPSGNESNFEADDRSSFEPIEIKSESGDLASKEDGADISFGCSGDCSDCSGSCYMTCSGSCSYRWEGDFN